MDKVDTWKSLINLNAVSGKMPERNWNLSGANLSGANLSRTNLRDADLRNANLSDANLSGADLGQTNLSGANLRSANLHIATLDEANLNGANLCGANLHRAILRSAILSGANISKADLREANFSGANLRGVNLTEAVINNVNFNLSDLSSADITGSTFWGVATSGWIIDGIKAHYVYFCRTHESKDKYKRYFQDGQFEALYKSLPKIELIFEEGLSPTSLLALTALLDNISQHNTKYGIKMADISKDEFETKVGVKISKDEYLNEVGKLIQDAVNQIINGISFDMIAPYLTKMLPENFIDKLEKEKNMRPSSVVVNITKPTLQFIRADGSILSGIISQQKMIKYTGDIIAENYTLNKEEADRLFDELKEALSKYEASVTGTINEEINRMIEAIKTGKEVNEIQEYWEQIKEGVKTSGAATTIISAIGRLLGFM
jgi:hypothetical protein